MKERLPLILWLTFMAVCAWVAFRAPISSDLTHFLPTRAGMAERILVDQLRQGAASRLILMALEGPNEAELAQTSNRLADALRQSPLFTHVNNGSQPLSASERDFLFTQRYLLSPEVTPERFSVAGLKRLLEMRLSELASPAGLLQKEFLPRDPTGEFLQVVRVWSSQEGPATRQGVWFSPNGKKALLIAETQAPGFDFGAQAEAVKLIRESFAAARGHEPVALQMAGPPVFSVEANSAITRDATRLSILNVLAVTALLWAVYRSARVILLGLIPLASGALAGAAAVSLVFGGIHGITLGFGATLIGVAADYPNHLFTHSAPGESPRHAVRRIWPTLRLGILTNIAGFAAMLFSGFQGLSQLGVFAAAGLLTAGAACRWIVPLLMSEGIRLPQALIAGLSSSFRPPLCLRPIPLLAGAGAIAWLWASPAPMWNDDVNALSPVPEASKKLDETLRAELGAPDLRKLILVLADSEEQALERSERLAAELRRLIENQALTGFDMAALYLPSKALQARRQAALPDRQTLALNLHSALRELPFRDGAFEPFLSEVADAKTQSLLDSQNLASGSLALRINALLFRQDGRWVALVPLKGVVDERRITDVLTAMADPDLIYLDLKEETGRLLTGYRLEALHLLGWSLFTIVLLLTLGLRSVGGMLRVLLPMLAAACVTAAIMAEAGGGLSLFHLVSLLLVMGLGMDQALFFNRTAANPEEKGRTLLSLLLCSLSAVIAFGILASSGINILHAIGATVALGAFFALLFAAMLARRDAYPA
ncbi:MAG TPA: MMPL family transporter [Methylococcaceae bacterium]|nr:MMPL family transporter [Methylococcaceae bacterium]